MRYPGFACVGELYKLVTYFAAEVFLRFVYFADSVRKYQKKLEYIYVYITMGYTPVTGYYIL